ncbi:type 1 phosphatidylinositol 4,5-bisphosphate 4-phosphatase-like [Amphiprion ocellaris]|uniref:Phosphatidylinositol-4,5-bisphosphate 4-phosphatase n=1 Tax=Amphiprion ocellaris TaxID=80972 RepID=A0A3Q1ARS3_AMPOC|nr:type 1 phosphatidylinositol 4,5-bisphosphate 4-phosphatase-like [Amphiprion ocellaris]
MAEEEKTPLLCGVAADGSSLEVNATSAIASAPPLQEEPPPYSVLGADCSWVNCGVCRCQISVNKHSNQHLVKCSSCHEATPVRNPPVGKKYIRCPCNCLLICKATSQRVACPRPSCKRIIELGAGASGSSLVSAQLQPCGSRVSCGHCCQIFLWTDLTNKKQARCPHCRKVSFVGRRYPWRRFIHFFLIGMFFAAITGILAGCTWEDAREHGAIYAIWTVLVILCVASFGWSIYWLRIKISEPIQNYT